MESKERKRRARALLKQILEHDIADWLEGQFRDLSSLA
jgi:trehalose-6-phosphate synthase